jgi:hypothetical protein
VRKLVLDFDVTVLLPLILFVLVVLWNVIQVYRWPSEELYDRKPFDEGEELVNWRRERRNERDKAKRFIWFFAIALGVLCGVMFSPGRWKIEFAYPLWDSLWLVSAIAFVILIPTAWHYARKLDWLRLIACLLAMLMAAASAEHFFHQKINARHVSCPYCSDDDDRPDDN